MDKKIRYFLKNYLSNIQVDVSLAGHNWVGIEWRDINYKPEYNKFYFICDGEGWLKIGDKEYFPKPGQLFLMPAGVIQSYSTINSNCFTKYWCHFTAKIGDRNIFDILELQYFIEVSDKQALEVIFEEMLVEYHSQELTSALLLKSSILRLISFYLDNCLLEKVKVTSPDTVEVLGNVVDYINNNFNRDVSVKELADIAHLQPNYFIKVFRNHLGASPIRFLNKRRIDEARFLLTTTNLTFTEIGYRVGISNPYYFSKLFKEYTGITPSSFKEMNRPQENT